MQSSLPQQTAGSLNGTVGNGGVDGQTREQPGYDPLTGLHSRGHFDRELAAQLARTGEHAGEPSALLLIDVDAFRFVNDSLGHEAGDRLLKEIGSRLRGEAREYDLLARIGGDEFALLLARASRQQALAVANRLIEAIRADTQASIGVSVGIAVFDGTAELTGNELLIAADIALFEAKEAGRGQAVVYTGQRGHSLTWVERIREAMEGDRLLVYAQPIIDLKSGSIDRDELLIRMLDTDGNLVPPDAFLPTAERFGLIEEIDRLVLEKAVGLAGRSRPMAINLSGPSLSSGTLLEEISAAIEGGLDPSWLDFEITETAAVANLDQARHFAKVVTGLGCRLGLDDFGTGFSSFNYLKHLPVNYIKIDIEFIREVRSSTFDQRVVQAIVTIARELEIETVAEGVEDAQALAIVEGLGVDFAQGFYLARPYLLTGPTPTAP